MNLIHYNSEIEINEEHILWRYMNFQKVISLVKDNQLYFARLDKFNDPLEGLSFVQRESLSEKRNYQHGIYFPDKQHLIQNLHIYKKEIRSKQQGSYASCWYMTKYKNDESGAMWSLYGDTNSFAVAIPFHIMRDAISESLLNFIDAEIIESLYGKVEYLGTYDYAMKKNVSRKIASGFIKSPNYAHEQELRFMLFRDSQTIPIDRDGIKLPLHASFTDKKSEIGIFAHPDMDLETFNLFKDKFESLGFILSPSRILTYKNIKNFLED